MIMRLRLPHFGIPSLGLPGSRLGLLLVAVLLLGSCSVADTMSLPHCEEGGSVLILTQSVPSAELVPCFQDLPEGWELESISITHDGSVIELDHDRVGQGAALLRFGEVCDTKSAAEVQSEWAGAQAFEEVKRGQPAYIGQRFYVFNGGCIWWDFDFTGEEPAITAFQLRESLVLLTRVSVNEGLHASFMDEDL